MFEQVHNIIIKGEHFAAETCLNNLVELRLNILFGRNGSGKSTIGRALKELSDTSLEADKKQFSKIDMDQPLTDDDRRAIHVFNEQFIEKYVKINEDALGPIVMLGEQVGIAEKIAEKEAEILIIQSAYDLLLSENQKLNDSHDVTSPLYQFNNLKQKLTAVGGWAELDSKCRINPNRRNSPVTEDTIRHLTDKLTSDPLTPVEFTLKKQQFDSEYSTFQRTAGQSPVSFTNKRFSLPFVVADVNSILHKVVQRPELTERERLIASLASNDIQKLSRSREIFSSKDVSYCPCCYRPIAEHEKTDLCNNIEKILNREVEDYTQSLNTLKDSIVPMPFDYAGIEHLFRDGCNALRSAIVAYNEVLNSCRTLIGERLVDIFGHFEKDFDEELINASIAEVIDKYESLKKSVDHYNTAINERSIKASDLNTLNSVLTAAHYKNEIKAYNNAVAKLATNKTNLANKQEELETAKTELATLNQSLEQTEIALSFINECLAYVYFSRNRLVLEEGDKCYRLKSNGVNVKPGNVSIGERNIIALCYFFASLFNHIKKEDQYKQEMFLVIDDPVSSFDMDNRMGVMSFLRWQIDKVLKGNANSKFLVMTHDLRVVFDLEKIVDEVTGKKRKYNELINKTIVKRQPSEGNEYTMLYYNTYIFATIADPTSSEKLLSMGNIMRRLLEAYFTFNYRKSFYEYVYTDEFLDTLPVDYRTYYQNLLTRLVLNGSSHEEEAVRAMTELFALFTPNEMQITAKSIILLFHLLNKLHTKQYLGSDAVTAIDTWIADGFGRVVV